MLKPGQPCSGCAGEPWQQGCTGGGGTSRIGSCQGWIRVFAEYPLHFFLSIFSTYREVQEQATLARVPVREIYICMW